MAEKTQLAIDFVREHPNEAARILEEQSPGDVAAFFERAGADIAAAVLDQMLPAPAARCVRELESETAAMALAHLRPGTATTILRCLPEDMRDALLHKMPKRMSLMCAVLLNYAPATVGAWLDPLVLVVPVTCTAAEAMKRIKDDPYDDFRAVYVVDDTRKLKGVVSLDVLISSESGASVSSLMKPAHHHLPDRAPLTAVSDHPGWEDFEELPVLDRSEKFVGTLRHAELRHALKETVEDELLSDGGHTLIGFVEASVIGVSDILEATLAPAGASDSRPKGENR